MRRALLLSLIAVPLAAPAEMYDAEYESCSTSTTVDIVQCVKQAGKKWDQRLNKAYKSLMERSEPQQNVSLKKAQRLWIQYRDANCAFYAAGEGSIAEIEAQECIRAMTKARTCELDRINRGDSRPDAQCNIPVAQTAEPATRAVPTPTPHAATPSQGANRNSLPITMESTLEGIPRQHNASFLAMHTESPYNKKKPYGSMHTNVHFEREVPTAGGSAVFGWLEDSQTVVLVTHAKSLPALTLSNEPRD